MNLQEQLRKINEINKKRKLEEQKQDEAFERILDQQIPVERLDNENE
ncbi:hypothetical protein [Bacillus subtilis]|nr:hypothetical protein [Bacillus subtilis]GLI90518.1 hypothetical protein ANABIO4_38700 [Bacillus subtilis]